MRKITKNKSPLKAWRLGFVLVCLLFVGAIIFFRLIQIQVLHAERYKKRGIEQYIHYYVKKAPRGFIYDRNMVKVVLNKPCFDIGLDKRLGKNYQKISIEIGSILNIKPKTLLKKIEKSKFFVLLKRQVDKKKAEQIRKLKMKGITVIESNERNYPLAANLAQLIGFADVDSKGISGIELEYEHYLKGKDGWSLLQKDAKGKRIMPIRSLTKEPGADVVLTIDHIIQTIAEEELSRAVKKFQAKGGTVIVTRPITGEILAVASLPGFDPNYPNRSAEEFRRIRSITDIFEPGSTFKIVTMMAALSEGVKKPSDIIFCENGRYNLFGETINDTKKHGWLSFRNVFKYSSNIGTAKIAREIGKVRLFKAARNFGFGNKTGIGLPGEVTGILRSPKEWSNFSVAAISYGHEIAVTSLQMAMAYGAIANGGLLMQPLIINKIVRSDEQALLAPKPQVIRRVMSPEVAEKMTSILIGVVENGTGKPAKIENLKIAGKTGTAQKLLPGGSGYSNSRYVASFAGFYPANKAEFLIYINIDEPYPVHSGGSVAGPSFRKMLQRILEIYDIPKIKKEETDSKTTQFVLKKTIPDLRKRRLETAKKILNDLEIDFMIQGNGNVVAEQQTVLSESGKEKSTVNLILAEVTYKKRYATMPNLIGMPMRKAISEISLRRLKAKIVGRGRLQKQDPQPGSKIKVGARCVLEFKEPGS